jgi:ABC-type sugar transport system ATPase subunit
MIEISFKGVSKSFEQNQILKRLDLEVQKGELLAILGPSGCGKSTLLRLLAGLEEPDSGNIEIGGKSMLGRPPQNRHLAMVFQNYALYPHLTIFDNLAFGLRMKNLDESEISKRVFETAEMLKLESLLSRRPKELSGGQRQRVALGRALARRSRIILFDEPLSNLDAQLRHQMRYEIKKIHAATQSTILYVTHDQVEATTLGDRIAIFNNGFLQQIDTSENIYHRPANLFVASFLGSPEINIFKGEWLQKPGCLIGIRPEKIRILSQASSKSLRVQLELQEFFGSQYLIHAKYEDFNFRILQNLPCQQSLGSTLHLEFDTEQAVFFDPSSGVRIN